MANFSRVPLSQVRNGAPIGTNGDTDDDGNEIRAGAQTATQNRPPEPSMETADTVVRCAQVILDNILNQGQMTKSEIRLACKEHDPSYDTATYQKALARLANQAKIITEVSREDGSKAMELKRDAAELARAGIQIETILSLQEGAAAPVKKREVFDNFYLITGVMVVRSPVMASRPVLGNQSARSFLRGQEIILDEDGQSVKERKPTVLLSSANFDAMFKAACKNAPGVPKIGNAIYHVFWDQQDLPLSLLGKELNPVPPSRPGQSGQGITEVESLPVGTVIPFSAMVPGTHVSADTFCAIMAAAGRYIGFSPSGAHKGWGRFYAHVKPDPSWAKITPTHTGLGDADPEEDPNATD